MLNGHIVKKHNRRQKIYKINPKQLENGKRNIYISNCFKLNGLNASTKRHRLAEWIQKQDPHICCLQETRFRSKDTYRLKVRGWKNIFHANGEQKKAGVTILISDKIGLKIKITRDKEGHYIMIKGSIQEEDITIVNTHGSNIGAPQYTRQTLTDIKVEIDSNTIIVGDFNTPLTPMERSSE